MVFSKSKSEPIVVKKRQSAEAPAFVRTDARTHKFITTRRYPFYYLPITKCGSTYLKNLMYLLDHDAPHPHADNIHEHAEDFRRADDVPRWMIETSPYAFTVLRKPSSRFLSLYFDKIYGEGPQNFPEIRKEIANDCGLDLTPGLDVDAHRANCFLFIAWIEKNLAWKTGTEINPHWRPQTARIQSVEHFKPAFLTLDGLDEQLSVFLGDLIPDLAAKMASISVRNKSKYAVSRTELLTRDLEAAINRVYADDLVRYQHFKRHWTARLAAPVQPVDPAPRINALTTHRVPLNLIVMQKAGCTFLRNLTYALDHGRPHPTPALITSDDCLVHRERSKADLAKSVNLIVLRDPFKRFFSLYFDKVWGDGEQAFPWIARQLQKNRRFRRSRALSEAEHHDNCCRFLGFLQTRFDERPLAELNPHWQPQSVKVERARAFGFQPVLLEQLESQMKQLVGDRIEGFDAAFAQVNYRNETEKPIDPEKLLSPWIRERLQALYGDDIALYERVKAGWAETGAPPKL